MTPPDSYILPPLYSEETAVDVTRVPASTSVFCDSPSSYSPSSDSLYLDTSSYLAFVNQASFNSVAVQDYSLASNLSLNPNNFDTAFAFLDLTQDQAPWRISSGLEYGLGPVFAEGPVISDMRETSDAVPWCPVPKSSFGPLSISQATNPDSEILSLGQDMEESFRNTPNPFTCTVVGIPHPRWGMGQPETGFSSENPSVFDLTGPSVWIDGTSCPAENAQIISSEPEAVQNPYYAPLSLIEQQPILFEEPMCYCEWKDEDQTVCGEALTRVTLPGHLSKHGIKKKSRDSPTKCNWIGCKMKRTMNRESIVRHIREVHMRLKRPSKKV